MLLRMELSVTTMPSKPLEDNDKVGPDFGGPHDIELLDPAWLLESLFLASQGTRLPARAQEAALEVFGMNREVLRRLLEAPAQMTAEDVKAIREKLGFSQDMLARVLRLGPHGKRTVARWEAGDNPVSGPASVALEALRAGWLPGDVQLRDLRETYTGLLDAIEKAVLQAREHVRNTGDAETTDGVARSDLK